jgi:hypothetical protein
VIRGQGELHNEEHHNLYSFPNIIRMIKSRRMQRVGHIARMVRPKIYTGFGWKARRKETISKT